MRLLSASIGLVVVLFAGPVVAQSQTPLPLAMAAPLMLHRDHNAGCGIAKDSGFKAQLDFAGDGAFNPTRPWEQISFQTEPARYMQTVLDAAIADNDPIHWDIGKNSLNGWVHAPWMAQDRDPFNGLTFERQSKKFELAPTQTQAHHNYAVGIYNAIAARAFAKLWTDPAKPSTKDFAMAPGSVAVKLLFSTADETEVPYLKGSWVVDVCDDGVQAKARLAQVDIAVRDTNADQWTGWVFGTFVYSSDTATSFSWSNVHPFTLIWGNDPGVYPNGTHIPPDPMPTSPAQLPTLSQTWFDTTLQQRIWDGRLAHGIFPWTGLFGRANGPIDNPVSSCLSCHNAAADFGRGSDKNPMTYIQDAEAKSILMGNAPSAVTTDFFQNRKGNEPKLAGTLALDYSLQAMVGLLDFRAWVTCRGDTVAADIAPYMQEPPHLLVQGSDDCKKLLAATGDVYFDTPTATPPVADPMANARLGDVLRSIKLDGGDIQLPLADRSARD